MAALRAAYPERIVKIVVPFAPGGGTDWWRARWHRRWPRTSASSVIIENKPGAGTIIGTQAVATSEADGYTLLMGTFANAVNPSLYVKLPYDQHQRSRAVALVARSFNIVVVNPKSPIAVDHGFDRGRQGRARQAVLRHLWHRHVGASRGRIVQSYGEVNLTTVPYKGSAPAITDLIGGQIQVMFTTVASAAPWSKAGSCARWR